MMRIENAFEYFGAKEYQRRLNSVLADGRSSLSAGDWELFAAPVNRRVAEVEAAVGEYEARIGLTPLAPPRMLIQHLRLENRATIRVTEQTDVWNASALPATRVSTDSIDSIELSANAGAVSGIFKPQPTLVACCEVLPAVA